MELTEKEWLHALDCCADHKDRCHECPLHHLITCQTQLIKQVPSLLKKSDGVEHGEWIKNKRTPEVMKRFHEMGLGTGMSVNSIYWTCSVCGNWGTPNHKYCCSCGAKMKYERK